MLPSLLREPWAISESGMQLVLAVATRDEFFAEVREQALAARNGEPMKNTRTVALHGATAVIPVKGPLFKHAPLLAAISGATDYSVIRKDLRAALEDPAVSAILLDIDSPGGEVNGCGELAQAIYDARGKKKIEAYVGGSGSSAAFWIASAAERVTVASTAMVGSIGVLASFTWKDEQGTKKLDIVSSQSPNKLHDPATEGGRALLQARVDDLAEVFIASVAKHRGVTTEKVAADYGQGGVFVGAKAVMAGLADAVGTFETVLASLAPGARASTYRGATVARTAADAASSIQACGVGVHAMAATRMPLDVAGRAASIDARRGAVERAVATKVTTASDRLRAGAARAMAQIEKDTPPPTSGQGAKMETKTRTPVQKILAEHRQAIGPAGLSRDEDNARAKRLMASMREAVREAQPLPTDPDELRMRRSIAEMRVVNGTATPVDVAFLAATKAEAEKNALDRFMGGVRARVQSSRGGK